MFEEFNFIFDIGNYADRKVARNTFDWGFISTARVSDGDSPYETAVLHKRYNANKIMILDKYKTVKDALEGHQNLIKLFMSIDLPLELKDCKNSGFSKLVEGDIIYILDK